MTFLERLEVEQVALEESAMSIRQKEIVADLMKSGWEIEDKRHGSVYMTKDGKHRLHVDKHGQSSVIQDDVERDVSELVEDFSKLTDEQLDAILS